VIRTQTKIRDGISPALERAIRASRNSRAVLEAMGTAMVSLTVRAFRQPALRPGSADWGKSRLYKSGALKHSIRITSLTDSSVSVGSDRPYAIYHQFGTRPYRIRSRSAAALFWKGAAHPVRSVNHPGLPARPFFPVDANGSMTALGTRRVSAAARAKLRALAGG